MNKPLFILIISLFLVIEGQLAGLLPVAKINNVSSNSPQDTSLMRSSVSNLNSQVIAKALPSVVTIKISETTDSENSFKDFDPLQHLKSMENIRMNHPEENNIGSGFIVDPNGLVATNKHVVSRTADYSIITSDNKEYKVTNIYVHPETDLAILEVVGNGFTPINLGDSSRVKLGDPVYAMGTTMGDLTNSVTSGIVSGLGRGITAGDHHDEEVDQLEDAIQTDAAINPGNSGGPLINGSAEVIGINTAGSSEGQNIGFAIPVDVLKNFLTNYKSEKSSI